MQFGQMKRREFIAVLGAAVAARPLAARAQPPAMPVIGLLSGFAANSPLVANFHRGLKESGFSEGQNVALDYRSADGQYDRLPELAADLIKKKGFSHCHARGEGGARRQSHTDRTCK